MRRVGGGVFLPMLLGVGPRGERDPCNKCRRNKKCGEGGGTVVEPLVPTVVVARDELAPVEVGVVPLVPPPEVPVRVPLDRDPNRRRNRPRESRKEGLSLSSGSGSWTSG